MSLPVFAIISKADGKIPPVTNNAIQSGDWNPVAVAAELQQLRIACADTTGIPYERIFVTFGLHRLNAIVAARVPGVCAPHDDAREVAILTPLFVAVREALLRARHNNNQHVRIFTEGRLRIDATAVDNTPHDSILHADPQRLAELLSIAQHAQRPIGRPPSAQSQGILKATTDELKLQDIDGRMLAELPDRDMRELLVSLCPALSKSRGVLELISRVVSLYRI